MREVAFIKQNKEKWLEFEQAIFGKSTKNPDELANLYIHLVNDLSYAQTFYPKSKTTVYLNYLASNIYQKIYKTKRLEKNKISYFFKQEVPLLCYQYRSYFLFAFVLFFAFLFIGIISTKYDETYARSFFGDEYVNTTLENIKKGNPVAIYKSSGEISSFLGITINNIKVGAKMYISGLTGGILTFYMLLQNSSMVGCFQYFFYQQGVLWQSIKGIWLHGSMEIFSMIIEAACGFILAASLFFPKTYSRTDSLKIGFGDSIKIYIATIPFTIAAGFIEGFITRWSKEMPLILNILIIGITLSGISYYFLLYPKRVFQKVYKNSIHAS